MTQGGDGARATRRWSCPCAIVFSLFRAMPGSRRKGLAWPALRLLCYNAPMPQEKPKRRWYQFSLRTFFVLVTLVCVGFGYWVHWSKEWIRLRKEWRDEHRMPMWSEPKVIAPPRGLWLFGEEGVTEFFCE